MVLPFSLRVNDFQSAMQDVYDFFYDVNTLLLGKGLHRLVVQGRYANKAVASGTEGVEIKSTRKKGGAVDTHGGRNQWMCVFVYTTDHKTEPAQDREPMKFTEVYIGDVKTTDFRNNPRGELGTRTSTLRAGGMQKLRSNWVYLVK